MTTLFDTRTEPMLQRLNDLMEQMSLPRPSRDLEHFIRVEESMTDGTLQIRAEIPGVNPDTDIDIEVAEGVLTISAERTEQRSAAEADHHMSEFQYGSFKRSLRVPDDLNHHAITAEYRGGILTVTVPMPAEQVTERTRIPITDGD
jgi:HSP20 family molecular chaperone IbpA